MNGFDPIICLKRHIAFLTLLKAAVDDVADKRGVELAVSKWTGRALQQKVAQSIATMKDNKMWVQHQPIGERRCQYSLIGSRNVYEISVADLELNTRMIIDEMERELQSLYK